MKRSHFTKEQIIAMIKEQEAGSPTADVCRKYGISSMGAEYNLSPKSTNSSGSKRGVRPDDSGSAYGRVHACFKVRYGPEVAKAKWRR